MTACRWAPGKVDDWSSPRPCDPTGAGRLLRAPLKRSPTSALRLEWCRPPSRGASHASLITDCCRAVGEIFHGRHRGRTHTLEGVVHQHLDVSHVGLALTAHQPQARGRPAAHIWGWIPKQDCHFFREGCAVLPQLPHCLCSCGAGDVVVVAECRGDGAGVAGARLAHGPDAGDRRCLHVRHLVGEALEDLVGILFSTATLCHGGQCGRTYGGHLVLEHI
mmetsp:Transcript_116044/g.248126  ORF Transcript_116044/g.248126 Transcript_116044/m.248126 type:complete len:220 (-) Transcript_116044:1302-1961(-)